MYRRAVDVHVASGLLAGELQSAARALPVRALGGSAAPDLTPVSADFPNLSSLFQLADSATAEPCRSVHSAAAYLVDVLQFLGNRLVTDADTPGPATKVARDVLYGRRPDLGDLDLSCENTDLPLPYLDLVCELLEEAVAPDVGLAFGGPLSGGVDPVEAPSAGLLSLSQGQGWPFTDRSLVYEPDLAGARWYGTLAWWPRRPRTGPAVVRARLRQTHRHRAGVGGGAAVPWMPPPTPCWRAAGTRLPCRSTWRTRGPAATSPSSTSPGPT